MPEFDSTPETVRRLVELVTENGLTELTVAGEGLTVTVKAELERGTEPAAGPVGILTHPHPLPPSQSPAYSQTIVTAAPRAPSRPATTVALESPMVGVFYHSPSPEDPPFIHVGDVIRVGQPIGLIEAMKVYSEVPAEVAGRVLELAVENGKLVQQGQPLVYIEPS